MIVRRSLIVAAVLAAAGVAVPATAAAASAYDIRNFNAGVYGTQRLPSSQSGDRVYRKVSGNGRFDGDAPGSSCRNTFAFESVHDRTAIPDEVVFSSPNLTFCSGKQYFANRSWPSGTYHFDARVKARPDAVSGTGGVAAYPVQ